MEANDLITIITNYESRLKYIPTGVKQYLVSQILLNPLLIINFNKYCEKNINKNSNKDDNDDGDDNDDNNETKENINNYMIQQMICDNIDLYKTLWYTYISDKPLGNIDFNKLKNKYNKLSKYYAVNAGALSKNKTIKKYNVLYRNIKGAYKISQILDSQNIMLDESLSWMSEINKNLMNINYVDFIFYWSNKTLLLIVASLDSDYDEINTALYNLLKTLLEKGANPNMETTYGDVALNEIINKHDLKSAKLLIDYGAIVDHKNDKGTILMNVLGKASMLIAGVTKMAYKKYKKEPNVEELIEYEIDNAISKILTTAKFLLDNGANINATNNKNRTALFIVKDEKIVTFLINNGIDPNIIDDNGNTALMYLLAKDNVYNKNKHNVIDILYKYVTDINHKNKEGKNLLSLIVRYEKDLESLIVDLFERGSDIENINLNIILRKLFDENNNGQADLVLAKKLLDNGTNINYGYHTQSNLLFTIKYPKSLIFLMENGIDVSLSNKNHHTPLMEYIKNKKYDLAELLITEAPLKLKNARKLDANYDDDDGNTALLFAAMNNETKIAKMLINIKANVNVRNKDGFTPLKYFKKYGNDEAVKILLNTGATQ